MDSWLFSSFRCFFDSFHSLILFWKMFRLCYCLHVYSECQRENDAHKRCGTWRERDIFWIHFSLTPNLKREFWSIDLSLFPIGGCRQTVSSCFLFPCNLILSTEVTVLISINPKMFGELISHVLSFHVFGGSWYRWGPFAYLGILKLFSLSIKTSSLMTFQFEIDSITSYSCRHWKNKIIINLPSPFSHRKETFNFFRLNGSPRVSITVLCWTYFYALCLLLLQLLALHKRMLMKHWRENNEKFMCGIWLQFPFDLITLEWLRYRWKR